MRRRRHTVRFRSPETRPLRKVVGTRWEDLLAADGVTPIGRVEREVLECGHTQSARSDYIGTTNASRRRCRACPKIEQQPEPLPGLGGGKKP